MGNLYGALYIFRVLLKPSLLLPRLVIKGECFAVGVKRSNAHRMPRHPRFGLSVLEEQRLHWSCVRSLFCLFFFVLSRFDQFRQGQLPRPFVAVVLCVCLTLSVDEAACG